MKTTLLLGALVVATLVFSRSERVRAEIPPCYPNNCPDLTVGYDNLRPTADGFTVDVYAARAVGYEVYACLGNSTQCVGSQFSDPTMWKNLSQGICESSPCNVTYAGLRSSRTYQNIFIEAVSGAQYDNVNVGPVTTWPAPQFTPSDADAGCTTTCKRNISWTTPFPGDSTVIYGPNPPSWTMETNPFVSGYHLGSVESTSSGHVWAGGTQGYIVHRNPAGVWGAQNSGTTSYIYSISAYNDSIVWAAGQNNTVLQSTNGGQTWMPVPLPFIAPSPSNYNVFSIVATSSTTAVVSVTPNNGVGSYIYYYNGTTWNQVYSGATSLNAMTVSGNRDVWAVGRNGTIIHCENILNPGACTWTPVITSISDSFSTVATFDGQTIWIGGLSTSGLLYKITTPDNGATWNAPVFVNTGAVRIEKIHMVAANEFWAATEGSILHYKATAIPSAVFDSNPGVLLPGGIIGITVVRGNELIATGLNTGIAKYAMPTSSAIAWSGGSASYSHSPVISNLMANTTYYYAAESFGSSVGSGAFGGSFTTPALDAIPPTIAINPIPPFNKTCPLTITGTASDTAPGAVQNVTVTLDGNPPVTAIGTTSWSVSLPCAQLTGAVNHVITAIANDGTNNSTPATAAFIFDNTVPTVTISAPATVTTPTVTANGAANDNDQVSKIEISVNGGPRSNVSIVPSAAVSWSASGLALNPSLNTLVAFATDRAGNEGSASTNVTYNVPTFDLTPVPPASRTVAAGTTALFTIKVAAVNGFIGTVGLTPTSPPTGLTALMSSPGVALTAGVTADYSVLIVTSTPGAGGGPYTLTVTGTSGGITKTAQVTLSLTATPDFTLSAVPVSRTVVAGQSASFTLNVAGSSTYVYNSPPGLSWTTGALPAGVTAASTPLSGNPSGGGTATSILTLATTVTVATDTPIIVTANDGTLTHSVTVYLTATPPPDFDLTLGSAAGSVVAGSGVPAFFNAAVTALSGFTGAVHLALTSTDPNITAVISPNDFVPAGGGGTGVTINATAGSPVQCAPPGPCNFTLTLTGTSGTLPDVIQKQTTAALSVMPDIIPPTITNPTASVSFDQVTISWQTNELADSRITIYPDATQNDANIVGTRYDAANCTAGCHVITYTGLNPLTTYYYGLTSRDQAYPTGNVSTLKTDAGGPLRFTTSAAPDNTPPTISITQPAGGTEVRGTVTVTGVGADNNPMSRINFKITAPGASMPLLDTQFTCQ